MTEQYKPFQEWFTAIELSGLPGINIVSDSVRKRAKREEWGFKKVFSGGGGSGKVYSIKSLPIETQIHLGWYKSDRVLCQTEIIPEPDSEPDPEPDSEQKINQIADRFASLIRSEILEKSVVPRIGIDITLAALQNVYGLSEVRKTIPCAPEVIWDDWFSSDET